MRQVTLITHRQFAMNGHRLLLLSSRRTSVYLTLTDGIGLLATRSNVAARSIITPLPVKEVATMANHQLTHSVRQRMYSYMEQWSQ
jgi:hypothetical protein